MPELNTKVNPAPGEKYVMTQSLILVPFRADPKKLQARMLPKPLEPVGDGDIGWVFMVDTAMPGLREVAEGEPPDPDMTEFHELAIGMPAIYNGMEFGYMSQVSLDRQTAGLRRGILRNITYTQMTDIQPLLTGRNELKAGTRLYGISNRPHGELVCKLSIELTHPYDFDQIPVGCRKFAHARYLKDPANHNEPFIKDVPLFEFTNGLDGIDCWRGKTTLEFGGDYYGKWLDLGEIEPLEGYFYNFGYCYGSDSQVTALDEKGDWKWF